MDKFRYSIDLGSGYSLIDVYDNKLKTIIKRGVSDLIELKELTGSLSFIGQSAEDIFAKRTTAYKIPFKVEEYNGAVWQNFHECYVDIRGGYERLSRVAIISGFKEFAKPETKIIENLKESFNITALNIIRFDVLQDMSSQLLRIFSRPTTLSAFNYKQSYDIEQNWTSSSFQDSRWSYFYYVGSTGSFPNVVYEWACNSFELNPDLDGYDKITIAGVNSWVTQTASGDPADVTTDAIISAQNYRLNQILHAICQSIDSTVTYNDFYTSGFSAKNIFIGNSSEFLKQDNGGIEITLASIFRCLRVNYCVDWFIEDGFMKFRWKPLEYYIDTIDWSAETINVNNIDFAEKPNPDSEFFSFLDKDRDYDIYLNPGFSSSFNYSSFNLSYFEKGIPTDNDIEDNTVDFYADILGLKKSEPDPNKPVWVEYDFDTKVLTINDSKDHYFAGNGLTFGGKNNERYSEYNPFYVNNPDKSQEYNTTNILNADNRPIYEIQYNKWLNNYTDLSLFSRILFNNGNTGYLNQVDIDMDTGNAIFYIRFKEIIL